MTKLPMWVEKRGGLPFACTQCGDCCRGVDGYVWLETAEEVERLAAALELTAEAFATRYVRRVDGELALIDKPGPGGDCIFWDDDRGCTVYGARPDQCRTFPFWPEHLRGKEAWRRLGRECPGIANGEKLGRNYAPAEIRAMLTGSAETDVGGKR